MARPKETKVTRIKAGDGTDIAEKKQPKIKEPKAEKKVKTERKKRSFGPLGSFLGYFKGAWLELRQVRWPTRRATWGLTGAVLAFTAFFVIFITALDTLFKFLFEQILR